MAEPVDRDVAKGVSRGQGTEGADRARLDTSLTRGKGPGITRVSDKDYRCVWRPCLALEEDEDDETAG